jgi:hypothetical protein
MEIIVNEVPFAPAGRPHSSVHPMTGNPQVSATIGPFLLFISRKPEPGSGGVPPHEILKIILRRVLTWSVNVDINAVL